MEPSILIGTGVGLWELTGDVSRPVEALAGHAVTALARDGAKTWAVIDGAALWVFDGAWTPRASVEGPPATWVAPAATGPIVGTEQGHLLRLTGNRLSRLESFEIVEGREAWYQPWGDPADVRSIVRSLATAPSTSTSTSAVSHARGTAGSPGSRRWTSRPTSTRYWHIRRAPRS
jgi:hypothetical protein